MNITFTDTIGVSKEFFPKTASSFIPDWYKDMESYLKGNKKVPDKTGQTLATIKRCMPVFDAITGGYILTTYVDVYVSHSKVMNVDMVLNEETGEKERAESEDLERVIPHYEWPSYGPLGFHPVEQAPNHPNNNGHDYSYPKWINPWAIKTPPGYSVLFIQPMHRESIFTILPGIVDTDTYSSPVNFPFVLNDVNFEGMIPAGTPMAQIVPFKRDEWQMSIGSKEDLEHQFNTTRSLRTRFFDSYKRQFRQPKIYR
jgi:hypothetical protein